MNRFSKNDLLDLIKEVVSSIKSQNRQWLLESPQTKKGVLEESKGSEL